VALLAGIGEILDEFGGGREQRLEAVLDSGIRWPPPDESCRGRSRHASTNDVTITYVLVNALSLTSALDAGG